MKSGLLSGHAKEKDILMDIQNVIEKAFYPRQLGPLPAEFSELMRTRIYPQGSVIIRQGEPASEFFYVNYGHVRATIVRPDGTEKVLAFAEPGQYFADIPFMYALDA